MLFPLAGIIHLSTHSFDLNEDPGFGPGKAHGWPCSWGCPCSVWRGVPALNGYVSKTLLHESIVEYIPLAGEYDLLFSALEGLFLFSGGADSGL